MGPSKATPSVDWIVPLKYKIPWRQHQVNARQNYPQRKSGIQFGFLLETTGGIIFILFLLFV